MCILLFEWVDIPPSAQARQDARTAGSRTRQRLQQAPNDMTVSIFDRQSPEWIFCCRARNMRRVHDHVKE